MSRPRNLHSGRTVWMALTLAAAAASAALAQQTRPAGQPLTDPAAITEVFEACTQLIAPTGRWQPVSRAVALLERHGVQLDHPSDIDAIRDSFNTIEYEKAEVPVAEAKKSARVLLKGLREKLFTLLPPLHVIDAPDDEGRALVVYWRPVAGAKEYVLERQARNPATDKVKQPWREVKRSSDPDAFFFEDKSKIGNRLEYVYRLSAIDGSGAATVVATSELVRATKDWFKPDLTWLLLFTLVVGGAVVYYIVRARQGATLKVRKIAGLAAVDEAVGRATEMGRPILFIPGIQDMNDIQTVAGMIVLGGVAGTAAEHDAVLEVPTCRSLVMTAARETVQASYSRVGRPDAYDEKRIYYTTDEQFGYVAAVAGTMVREKPAACFYMGSFYAESLILAETGNFVGSIQIAGTAQPSQLPFFVAACDYTLLGEEFFAASAYLSGSAQELGSLKGQDVGKAIAIILLLLGSLLYTSVHFAQQHYGPMGHWLEYLQREVLNDAG